MTMRSLRSYLKLKLHSISESTSSIDLTDIVGIGSAEIEAIIIWFLTQRRVWSEDNERILFTPSEIDQVDVPEGNGESTTVMIWLKDPKDIDINKQWVIENWFKMEVCGVGRGNGRKNKNPRKGQKSIVDEGIKTLKLSKPLNQISNLGMFDTYYTIITTHWTTDNDLFKLMNERKCSDALQHIKKVLEHGVITESQKNAYNVLKCMIANVQQDKDTAKKDLTDITKEENRKGLNDCEEVLLQQVSGSILRSNAKSLTFEKNEDAKEKEKNFCEGFQKWKRKTQDLLQKMNGKEAGTILKHKLGFESMRIKLTYWHQKRSCTKDSREIDLIDGKIEDILKWMDFYRQIYHSKHLEVYCYYDECNVRIAANAPELATNSLNKLDGLVKSLKWEQFFEKICRDLRKKIDNLEISKTKSQEERLQNKYSPFPEAKKSEKQNQWCNPDDFFDQGVWSCDNRKRIKLDKEKNQGGDHGQDEQLILARERKLEPYPDGLNFRSTDQILPDSPLSHDKIKDSLNLVRQHCENVTKALEKYKSQDENLRNLWAIFTGSLESLGYIV